MSIEKILYTATATATGGRDGRAVSSDGALDVQLSVPRELGGAGGAGTNPEQLFAAGYAACFHSALQMVARASRADITDSSVGARVGIGRQGEGFGLEVTLEVVLPNVPADQARALMEQAHQVCPYSNATRGNIDVVLELGEA